MSQVGRDAADGGRAVSLGVIIQNLLTRSGRPHAIPFPNPLMKAWLSKENLARLAIACYGTEPTSLGRPQV